LTAATLTVKFNCLHLLRLFTLLQILRRRNVAECAFHGVLIRVHPADQKRRRNGSGAPERELGNTTAGALKIRQSTAFKNSEKAPSEHQQQARDVHGLGLWNRRVLVQPPDNVISGHDPPQRPQSALVFRLSASTHVAEFHQAQNSQQSNVRRDLDVLQRRTEPKGPRQKQHPAAERSLSVIQLRHGSHEVRIVVDQSLLGVVRNPPHPAQHGDD
jgi:hypothetical protein